MAPSPDGHTRPFAACGLAGLLVLLAGAPALWAEISIEAGRVLYEAHCARCHGVDLRGTGHPALDITWIPEDQRERFVSAVKRGKGFMPPVGRKLGADEIEAIWLFVQSAR